MESRLLSAFAPAERHEVRALDPGLFRRHPSWRSKGNWRGGFAVTAWLRFPEGLVEMAQLMLEYRDQERRKSYLVDRCLPNRQTLILLNGVLNLDIAGEASEVSLYLTGLSEDAVWMLDECRVEPNQPALLERKVSSGAGG